MKKLIINMSFVFVAGCHDQNVSHSQLMQNYSLLQKALVRCQSSQAPECMVVLQAGQDYLSLNIERQENPELFGQKILLAQEELGQIAKNIQALHDKLQVDLNNEMLSKQLIQLNSDYDKQLEKINILLAVVASTSPL